MSEQCDLLRSYVIRPYLLILKASSQTGIRLLKLPFKKKNYFQPFCFINPECYIFYLQSSLEYKNEQRI